MRFRQLVIATLLSSATAVAAIGEAAAAQCGNTSAGFEQWVEAFKQEAAANGVSRSVLDKSFANVSYNKGTIRADRGQKSFKLSFDQFMQKRGGQAIIKRGRAMKGSMGSLFSRIEQRYGVPAGPLLAIWGMETGFGGFLGKEHTLSAVSTLAFDCRRSDYFTDQLYAALQLVAEGNLSTTAPRPMRWRRRPISSRVTDGALVRATSQASRISRPCRAGMPRASISRQSPISATPSTIRKGFSYRP